MVAFEDAAALVGIMITAVRIYASHRLNELRIDCAASIAIGGVLAVVAALLAREAKSLLIGDPCDRWRVVLAIAVTDTAWSAVGDAWPKGRCSSSVESFLSASER